MSLNSLF